MRSNQLVWLKRDLRVFDHRPLLEASKRGPCVILYIYEPEVYENEDFAARHLEFINQSLSILADEVAKLGGRVTFLVGEAVAILKNLHDQHGFEAIWSHEETGNAVTFARDKRVKAWARTVGLNWHEFRQFGVVRGLQDRNGWARQWNQMMAAPQVRAPQAIEPVDGVVSRGIQPISEFGMPTLDASRFQAGGTSEGLSLIRSFLRGRGQGYQFEMSSPLTAEESCSRISAHLAYGTVSMRSVAQALKVRRQELRGGARPRSGDTWRRSMASYDKRLHWHCHFVQKLESQPSLEWQNMARVYDGLREADFDPERFDRWCEGQTGYPLVDACMRFLRHGGWLNFRMRAMIVSFASYHLWLDWRPTSRFLARQFLDYEPGIHYSQMQMQSGTTGINAVRIYSPIKQVADQDPDGIFIKRWVPELMGVPAQHIAQPHLMSFDEQSRYSCRIGTDYPEPLVDHRTAVQQAKKRIYQLRRQKASKEEAKAVFTKHGSRKRPQRGASA